MAGILKTICSSFGSFSILFYVLLNFTFATLELSYGVMSNSLALVSDSLHMYFDAIGITVGLIAQAIIRQERDYSNIVYSYGYGRADAVTGFASSCLLLFTVFMLSGEAVQRFFLKQEVKTENVQEIALAGLCLNLVGFMIIWINRSALRRNKHAVENASGGKPTLICRADEEYAVLLGMLLHVLTDALGSVTVIGSSYIVEQVGDPMADPAAALIVVLILVIGIMPLLSECKDILMQRVPRKLQNEVPSILNSLSQLPKVAEVRFPRIWTMHRDNYVATFTFRMEAGADLAMEEQLMKDARDIMDARGIRDATFEMDHTGDTDGLSGLGVPSGMLSAASGMSGVSGASSTTLAVPGKKGKKAKKTKSAVSAVSAAAPDDKKLAKQKAKEEKEAKKAEKEAAKKAKEAEKAAKKAAKGK